MCICFCYTNNNTSKLSYFKKSSVRNAHMCVCKSLCISVVYNRAQNSSYNLLSYAPDRHHCSHAVCYKEAAKRTCHKYVIPSNYVLFAGTTWSRCMAFECGLALTLHASSNWAVDAATCFDDDINFSSLAWPCTMAFAASHRLWVAIATRRAYNSQITQAYIQTVLLRPFSTRFPALAGREFWNDFEQKMLQPTASILQ